MSEENWTERDMTVFSATANGQPVISNISVSRYEFTTVSKLFSTRPLFEVLHELEVELNKKKAQIDDHYNGLVEVQEKAVAGQKAVIQKIRDDLAGVDTDLKVAVNDGNYALATMIEAKRLEVEQAILTAELELRVIQEKTQTEITRYVEEILNGKLGNGAKIENLDFAVIANVTRAILWEWLNVNMGQTLPKHVTDRAYFAGQQLEQSRGEKIEAAKNLAEFKKRAQARFSGGAVRGGVEAQPQPTNIVVDKTAKELAELQRITGQKWGQPVEPAPTLGGQQQKVKSAPPPIGRDGIPQWGSIGSR